MMPENNDQMIDPPVAPGDIGDDELTQWLSTLTDEVDIPLQSLEINRTPAAVLTPTNEEGTDDESDEGDDDDDDDGGEDDTQDSFLINGQAFPREDIERLFQFDQFLRANPEAAQRVNAALATTAPNQPTVPQTTPTPRAEELVFTPPTPPESLDLEDPAIKFLWEQHVGTERKMWERDLRELDTAARQQSEQQTQVQRQAADDMATALTQFRTQFTNLNDEDIAAIRKDATPLVEGYLKQLPPVQALQRSMEVAAYANAEIRKKLSDPSITTPTAKQRSATRKRQLGALSGTPRSAPRTEPSRPVYSSDRDMVNEFAKALAEQGLGS